MMTRTILQFSNHRYWCFLIFLSRVVSSFVTESASSFLTVQQHDGFQRVAFFRDRVALFESIISNLNDGGAAISSPLAGDEMEVDRRPYEQRPKGPRAAR